MSDEAVFLASIRAHPQDDLRRLVYADWLEERATDEARVKAEYLRLEVHVTSLPDDHPERDGFILKLRALDELKFDDEDELVPTEWKAAVARVRIENCRIGLRCPKTWDQLETTEHYTSEVRICSVCQNCVVYCDSVGMARNIAETMGHRVVIDLGVQREKHDMDQLRPPPLDYSGNYPGPTELDMLFGLEWPPPEREPSPELEIVIENAIRYPIFPENSNAGAPEFTPPPLAPPGLFRRLWRKLTGK